jgi:hypothetical protein
MIHECGWTFRKVADAKFLARLPEEQVRKITEGVAF